MTTTRRPGTGRSRTQFAVVYPRMWQRLRRLEWAAWVEGVPGGRWAIDRRIFAAASSPPDRPIDDPDGRLVERIRRRALVDHHPYVARLRDRLDDPSAGSGEASGRPSAGGRVELARRIEPDLVTLIGLRNELARALGAASYGHLALAAEDLDVDDVMATMRDLREASIDEAHALAADAGVTLETWDVGLDRLAGPCDLDAARAMEHLAARIGCTDLFRGIRVAVADGPLAGWTAAVSIPSDVRLLVRPDASLRAVSTAFHELGHALAYAGTRAPGIRAIPGDAQDEAMGLVMERIGRRLLLSDADRARLDEISTLEMARITTSALFEAAIQDEPARARDQYAAWYGPLAPAPDPVAWALDSFRSSDPFRIHAYALGAGAADVLAERLIATFGDDPRGMGEWLRRCLWAPGRWDTPDRLTDLAAALRPHVSR